VTTSGATKYLRMMQPDDINAIRPLVMLGERNTLGVRYALEGTQPPKGQLYDVFIDVNDFIIALDQGMSLVIPPKTNLHPTLLRTSSGLICFSIPSDQLNNNRHLQFFEDSYKHAIIIPRYSMRISDYYDHLVDTEPYWKVEP